MGTGRMKSREGEDFRTEMSVIRNISLVFKNEEYRNKLSYFFIPSKPYCKAIFKHASVKSYTEIQ